MQQSLSGGCACGAIRCESQADPILMLNCHWPRLSAGERRCLRGFVILPKADMFTATAQPWDHLHPDTSKLPNGPPG
jgi:hypothetical protein